jgi:hypothetical protein
MLSCGVFAAQPDNASGGGYYDFEQPNPLANKGGPTTPMGPWIDQFATLDGNLVPVGGMTQIPGGLCGEQVSLNPGPGGRGGNERYDVQANPDPKRDNKVEVHACIKATGDGAIRRAKGWTSSPLNDDICEYDFSIRDGKLAWYARGCNWRNQSLNGNIVVADGEWHTVTAVSEYIGQFYAVVALYVDGVLDAYLSQITDYPYAYFSSCIPDITLEWEEFGGLDRAHGFAGEMDNLEVDYGLTGNREGGYYIGAWDDPDGYVNPVDPYPFSCIPEPATLMLLLAGLGLLVRRKK